MPLFHPRVLERATRNGPVPPRAHADILRAWAANLEAGTYDAETQNDSEFIQRILVDVLGYAGSSSGSSWTVAKNQPVGRGNVDVALGKFGVRQEPAICAPLELKGARTRDLDAVMPGRGKSPVQQAWEYAMDAPGAQWVLVSNYREIRLYAVGHGRKDYEHFDLATIFEPKNYTRFALLLSADNLLGGGTRQLLLESGVIEKEITDELYAEYHELRACLIKEIMSHNGVAPLQAVELSQTILDRVLFVAFAEDRQLLKKGTLKEAHELRNPYSPQTSWDNFKGLFAAIDTGNPRLNIPGYNGGLFASNGAINALALSDEICARFSKLGEYDYESEVSVTILGHIFEQSISDLEEIKKELDPDALGTLEVGARRRSDGIYYTPPFITRHIVEQTVGRWLADKKQELGFDTTPPLTEADYQSIQVPVRGRFKGQVVFNANVKKHVALWENYRECVSKIRVVDPACGSGAFLNEVFDILYREGQTINRALETLHGGQTNLFRWDTHILANNIFGVDINRESVELTKLSLWLKTANRNEKLTYLEDNICVGNSLISNSAIAGLLAFDWHEKFNSIMAGRRFDVVVGNPPYVDSEAMTRTRPEEREFISRTYTCTRGNWDLYVAFLELGCNLVADDGYLSFITPDKWISRDFGTEIRKRVLPGLMSILPLGREVFESAIVDSIVTNICFKAPPTLEILGLKEGETFVSSEFDRGEINFAEGFDALLSSSLPLLRRVESCANRRLRDIAQCENACATSDAYKLKPLVRDAGSATSYRREQHYKVANTGTLSRYAFKWGAKSMRYLKDDYLFPIVPRQEFQELLGTTYVRRANSPKLIIKGLTLLDAALDETAEFVPGKTTLVIPTENVDDLKFLSAILNSKLISFYIKQKYASSSYNGGVNFTTEMLNQIPIPEALDRSALIGAVNSLTAANTNISLATAKLQTAARSFFADFEIGRQLERWFEISNADIVAELVRQGLTINLPQRSEWSTHLDQLKAEIADDVVAVTDAETIIENAIFDAYGLTSADREIVKLQRPV